jgi:hypothetical protein
VVLVDVQLSVLGLYLPPLFKLLMPSFPPQTIISLPVHTAVCISRPEGALVVLVAVQLSVLGSYLPPLFVWLPANPPHTTISLPVQTAVWPVRAEGALMMLVAVQVSSVQGSISGRV